MSKKKVAAGSAMAFIFLMGIVSLFSDMTHEGARSILGHTSVWQALLLR